MSDIMEGMQPPSQPPMFRLAIHANVNRRSTQTLTLTRVSVRVGVRKLATACSPVVRHLLPPLAEVGHVHLRLRCHRQHFRL